MVYYEDVLRDRVTFYATSRKTVISLVTFTTSLPSYVSASL
jgi:hypothetical protein